MVTWDLEFKANLGRNVKYWLLLTDSPQCSDKYDEFEVIDDTPYGYSEGNW